MVKLVNGLAALLPLCQNLRLLPCFKHFLVFVWLLPENQLATQRGKTHRL